jgi:hypothetical protein
VAIRADSGGVLLISSLIRARRLASPVNLCADLVCETIISEKGEREIKL